jgi:uncharacterized RDD family membrane protein YckC
MKFAGVWQRLMGWIIDVLITLPVSLIIHKSPIGKALILSQAVYMIFEGFYYISFWLIKGATPGMMLFKLKLITNNKLTLKASILRYIGLYISLFSLGLGSLWMMWDKNKQTWQDKIAKTFVVKTN